MLSLVIQSKDPCQALAKNIDRAIFVQKFEIEDSFKFIKEFAALNADNEVSVIPIVISSYGGSVTALLNMLEIIGTATKPVATIAMGAAMSCGSVLLASGSPGYRFAGEMTEIMIHEVSSSTRGKNSDIQNDGKQLDRLNSVLFSILAKKTGKSVKYFKDKIKASGNVDWYITAKQAKKMGLVDFVGVPVLLERES